MANTAQLDAPENPYRAPANWEPNSRGRYDDPLVIELRAFVGPQADYYLGKWARVIEDPQLGEAGMNWVALLVPVPWLGYRRMYKAALVLSAVELAMYCGMQLLFTEVFGAQIVPWSVTMILTVMIRVVCALYGNAWYLSYAQRAILEVRQQRLEGQHALQYLARRGGTSTLGMVLSIVLTYVAGLSTGFVLGILGYGG